jgi:hypothetical protein
MIAVGLLSGKCLFYKAAVAVGILELIWKDLALVGAVDVKSKRPSAKSAKITGIEFISGDEMVLISTADSRARVYRLDDYSREAKLVGHIHTETMLSATMRSGVDILGV